MSRKKKWARPVLTVLVRGVDGQERVLLGCKYGGSYIGPAGSACKGAGGVGQCMIPDVS